MSGVKLSGSGESTGSHDSQKICVGRVDAVHGIRGFVKLKYSLDDPSIIGDVYDEAGEPVALTVKFHKKPHLICSIEGVETRNEAEAWRGRKLYIDSATIPEADEGEFFYSDIIGLKVRDKAGAEVGKVVDMNDFGAGDVIEIEYLVGEKEVGKRGDRRSVCFTDAYVPIVDIAGGFIVIDI